MKEYCVDLEIAKELKENGFLQDTYFCWEEDYLDGAGQPAIILSKDKNRFPKNEADYYLAPTIDEILKELPFDMCEGVGLNIWRTSDNGEYNVSYIDWDQDDHNYDIDNIRKNDKKLANALAKLWLHFKKEGNIK